MHFLSLFRCSPLFERMSDLFDFFIVIIYFFLQYFLFKWNIILSESIKKLDFFSFQIFCCMKKVTPTTIENEHLVTSAKWLTIRWRQLLLSNICDVIRCCTLRNENVLRSYCEKKRHTHEIDTKWIGFAWGVNLERFI